MLNQMTTGLAALPGVIAQIPPFWLITLALAVHSCVTAARKKRTGDAFLLFAMLICGVVCVIYLCVSEGGIPQ